MLPYIFWIGLIIIIIIKPFLLLIAVAIIIIAIVGDRLVQKKDDNFPVNKPKKYQTPPEVDLFDDDPLKKQGDDYERYIGKRFEEKGDLVIYNGFIRGYEDGGVDLVAVSPDAQTINLVQCKNWHKMTMELYHIEKLYHKLKTHNFDFLSLPIEQIKTHLDTEKEDSLIEEIISKARQNKNHFTIRKTLYIASEKVVDLEIGKHLTMIQPHIYRYEDMKIVVEKI